MAIADAAGNGLLAIIMQFLAQMSIQCLQSWSSMAPSEELNLFFRCMFFMSLMALMHVSYESYVLYALMIIMWLCVLHVCTCASHESYGSESSQNLLCVELLDSFKIKEHISLSNPFLRIVIMPKSSARFMWYCAFVDHRVLSTFGTRSPYQFRNKVGAMQFMRRNYPTPFIGTYTVRKTIGFKGHVWEGERDVGEEGGICLSVS